MILSEWIRQEFGKRGKAKAARFLGLPYKTLISWCELHRFPRLREQELITLKSQNQVDLAQWRRAYLDKKDKTLEART